MATTKHTVLLIDDDESIRKVLRLRLERAGYRVLIAQQGEEGLALATTERPALILLDLQMPRMDGREVLRRLKANPDTKPIPVILLTGDKSEHLRSEGIAAGANAFVQKPVSGARLSEVVDTLLPAKK